MLTTTHCTYSNPVRYDGTVPTLPTHVFYFQDSNCTDNIATSSTSTTSFSPSIIASTSPTTTVPVYAYFSAGDVLIALLLFGIGSIMLMDLSLRMIDRVVTKRKWLAYGGGDVQIKEEP